MRTIQIRAASRLHFGLLAPGAGHPRRFGGAGVMVAAPAVRLSATAAARFAAEGVEADRVREFAERWRRSRGDATLPACRIQVESLPRMHAGLGVGSQLGLSVARLLQEWVREEPASPEELARSVGRGQRSAVGTYGFFYGGLVVERGKSEGEFLAPLECRLELPTAWRWLLACPRNTHGLHGPREQLAFAELRDADPARAARLATELHDRLLPAARRHDFSRFSQSLYQFGYDSGLSFAPVQGGPYNGPVLQQLVERIRELGIEGVGQSSWGPTIFALCPNQESAFAAAERLRGLDPELELTVTETCQHGAVVEPLDG